MKNKHNLLFALIYFMSIFVGYFGYLFTPLFENIYYGHIVYILKMVARGIIGIILAISLHFIYKKTSKEDIKKEKKQLTIKKVSILYFITLFFVTLISILAHWELKPLHDIGSDTYTVLKIYEVLCDMGVLIVEIYLSLKAFECFDKFYTSNDFKNYKYYSLSIVFLLLTFGTYRLIVDFSIYQFVLIPFIFSLGFIYPYSEKSLWKTFLICMLVFLF